MVGKHVYYAGQVQGVGFRYTARHLAEAHGVAGWVRNLPNGDVELVAEGEPGSVEAFLAALATRMAGCVERTNVTDEAPTDLRGFDIRS